VSRRSSRPGKTGWRAQILDDPDNEALIEQAAREMSGQPVPVTVTGAEWVKDDGVSEWRLTAVTSPVIDGPLSLTVALQPYTPESMGIAFRMLYLLGVPLPPPYGTESFWSMGWSEDRAAEHMTGAKVMVARSRKGHWLIVGAAV
jgi:hypothetical protein